MFVTCPGVLSSDLQTLLYCLVDYYIDVQCIFRPENGLQDIPVSSQPNLHFVYASDGS